MVKMRIGCNGNVGQRCSEEFRSASGRDQPRERDSGRAAVPRSTVHVDHLVPRAVVLDELHLGRFDVLATHDSAQPRIPCKKLKKEMCLRPS